MYDTTHCTMRVVGGLVMRDLKTESGDTMIALDLMYIHKYTSCSI